MDCSVREVGLDQKTKEQEDEEWLRYGGDEELWLQPCIIDEQRKWMPEQALWAAVIHQAVTDLFWLPKLTDKTAPEAVQRLQGACSIRCSAYSFLFSNLPMFNRHRRWVFESAGIGDLDLRKLRKQADEFQRSL